MKNRGIIRFYPLICLILFCCPVSAKIVSDSKTVNVKDFGVEPNTFFDVTKEVKAAIAKCKETPGAILVFPEGRYDFWDHNAEKREWFITNTTTEYEAPSKVKAIGLLFEDMQDVTIEGNGSLFVFHGKMITVAFNNCENMTLQNVIMDFERPSMSELTFDEVHNDHVIISIHPDSEYAIINGKLRFYGEGWGMNENFFSILVDTINGTNAYSSLDRIREGKVTEIAPYKLRVENDFRSENYFPGQTLSTRNHVRDHVGMFVNRSKNITLDNLDIHYMHGLGIVSQFSENLTYNDINIKPWRGRTIAAFADGMQFSGCRGHIDITNCHFKGLHDDPINVHGTYLRITGVEYPNILTVRYMHGQSYGFQPYFENDSVAFIQANTIRRVDYAVVEDVKQLSEREYRVRLSKPLPKGLKEGDCLENMTWTPSLRVSGCRMESVNTRGLLVTTPRKVVIENNYFYRTGMYAIMIAADAGSWYESGAVNDVTIRNNIFDACAYNLYYDNNSYAISIEPENHERLKNHWVHRNIHIEGNTFRVYDNNLIFKAKSTENLYFGNNIIENTGFVPALKNRSVNDNKQASIKVDNCTKVLIQNNLYELSNPSSGIDLERVNMTKKDIKVKIKK